jgi:hypothetical protein
MGRMKGEAPAPGSRVAVALGIIALVLAASLALVACAVVLQ